MSDTTGELLASDAEAVARDIDFCMEAADYATARTQLGRLIQLLDKPANTALVVRRAMFDRLPAQAFVAKDGVDWIRVGDHWIDFQKLIDGIAADLEVR